MIWKYLEKIWIGYNIELAEVVSRWSSFYLQVESALHLVNPL